ncbi:ATP-binding cassette domain-containing protein [Halomicronema sp. CCY15110]|uniref:ABC transporter ATP-binding protein n=1 Tax=Halomicronema sp. CCY15110 TaxID=2767773 RepID=UPI001950C95B|nr:ATP-binding cassette domain-containing protein [Halomicronema sp. CCY15110]
MRWLYELDHVTLKGRDGSRLIDSVSFGVGPQAFLALVGPAGAGKTTLLKLMNRLVSPSSGALYLEGQPLEAIAVRSLRQRVMLVGQSSQLLGMTVKQALHYPLALQQCPARDRDRRVNEVMERLQIPPAWLEKTELQLSGGQQQQVAIARALIARPQLLLLDEPTSALDVGAASRILHLMQTLIQEHELTVIMSNHQLDLVQDFCDRVLYLEKGRLKLDQPAAQIDWATLKQTFVQADAQARDEWGDADESF